MARRRAALARALVAARSRARADHDCVRSRRTVRLL